jgi:hypothetical protein
VFYERERRFCEGTIIQICHPYAYHRPKSITAKFYSGCYLGTTAATWLGPFHIINFVYPLSEQNRAE